MQRTLAVILIIGSLFGAAYAAAMSSASMVHGMSMRMDCGDASCASSSSAPAAPDQDCIDHCLAAARVPAIPVSPAAAGLFFMIAILAVAACRSIEPSFDATGAPPHLGPSLRTLALAGVVMRN